MKWNVFRQIIRFGVLLYVVKEVVRECNKNTMSIVLPSQKKCPKGSALIDIITAIQSTGNLFSSMGKTR